MRKFLFFITLIFFLLNSARAEFKEKNWFLQGGLNLEMMRMKIDDSHLKQHHVVRSKENLDVNFGLGYAFMFESFNIECSLNFFESLTSNHYEYSGENGYKVLFNGKTNVILGMVSVGKRFGKFEPHIIIGPSFSSFSIKTIRHDKKKERSYINPGLAVGAGIGFLYKENIKVAFSIISTSCIKSSLKGYQKASVSHIFFNFGIKYYF